MHTIGPLIDHRDPGIADILLHAPFGDVAVSAINLLTDRGDFITLVGAIPLDDRGQQRDQVIGVLAFLFGLRLVRQIDLKRTP